MIVMILVGGLVGAGAGVGLAAKSPDGPTAPAAIPAQFPNTSQRYLPRITVAAIADKWLKQANGFSCTPGKHPEDFGAKQTLLCTPKNPDSSFQVSIYYDDDTHVTEVDADCGRAAPDSSGCRTDLGNTAQQVLVASHQPTLSTRAKNWGYKNAFSDSQTVIGGIWLETMLDPILLQAQPAP